MFLAMRLTKIDCSQYTFLNPDDECYHIGEYTAGGGYKASDTNQQIFNLKIRPDASVAQKRYKPIGIRYWANRIANSNLSWDAFREGWTFVPFPCSKPQGHELYDDRMLRVLQEVAQLRPGIDIRPLLYQTVNRKSQHEGERLSPVQIREQLKVDHTLLQPQLRNIIIVDDIITRGASYAAARDMLKVLPGVGMVMGLFLAKTIRPPVDIDFDFLED